MGQKSSCCNTNDPPSKSDVDAAGSQENGIFLTRGENAFANNRTKKMAVDTENDMSLTKNDTSNQILSKHIRQFSQQSNSGKSAAEMALRIKQLSELVHYAPILTLKVLSSGTLPKGHTIRINAQGVENSFRNNKDGITYFGCKKRLKRVSKTIRQTEIINDYILPAVNPEVAKKHRGQHFQIEYHIPSNSYKIKDLGVGFGTFYKLDFPLVLKENHLVNMGLIFMVVNLLPNDKREEGDQIESQTKETNHSIETQKSTDPLLSLKFFGGNTNGDVKIIEPGPGTIQIGRKADCDIHLDENLISKYQCNVEFTPSSGWILRDGKEKRPSTNGTWLYISEDQTLYNGMVFKANQTIFQVSLS